MASEAEVIHTVTKAYISSKKCYTSNTTHILAPMAHFMGERVGWLIFGFYFTSKNLLVKLHLLVKLDFTSKKDFVV